MRVLLQSGLQRGGWRQRMAHQRHQVHVKPWMALVAVFILVKLMGAFVPPLQVGDDNAFSRHGCVYYILIYGHNIYIYMTPLFGVF